MMKATVTAADFAAAVKQSIAQRTGTMPILQHAHVEAAGDILRITTTDIETYCTVSVPAVVKEPGAVCANDALMRNVVAVGNEVRLEQTDAQLLARCGGRNVLRIPTMPAHDFPTPDVEMWEPLKIDPSGLRAGLNAVSYAAARFSPRGFLMAVHVRAGGIEAADGYRLAIADLDYDGASLLIPAARAESIAKLLEPDAAMHVVLAKNGRPRMLRILSGRTELTVMLLSPDMVYPDLHGAIPTDAECAFTVERADFLAAVAGVSPFAKDSGGSKLITNVGVLSIDESGLQISDRRESNILAVEGISDVQGTMRLAVQLDILAKAIDAAGGDRIRVLRGIQPFNKQSAILITAVGNDRVRHVVAECKL